jgi:hypothetical protein
MNTVMEDKIKQAFQEWKETDKPKEKEMNISISRNKQLSNMLLDKITAEPGITGKELRTYIAEGYPDIPISYVPAVLKGFHNRNIVSREGILPGDGKVGRSTFAYTFVPPNKRKVTPKKDRVKAYTKKKANKGISALVPAERVVTRPLDVGPTTLHITISTSLGAYSMKLDEAKFIYQQLNQIFGGVR